MSARLLVGRPNADTQLSFLLEPVLPFVLINDDFTELVFHSNTIDKPGVGVSGLRVPAIVSYREQGQEFLFRGVPAGLGTSEPRKVRFLVNASPDFERFYALEVDVSSSSGLDTPTSLSLLNDFIAVGLARFKAELLELERPEGSSIFASRVISLFDDGSSFRGCLDQCAEDANSSEITRSCILTCYRPNFESISSTSFEQSVPFDPTASPADGNFLALFSPVGPRSFPLFESDERRLIAFPYQIARDAASSEQGIPERGLNLFVRDLSNDRSVLVTRPTIADRDLADYRKSFHMEAQFSSDGTKLAFVSQGQMDNFTSSRPHVYIATLKAESTQSLKDQIEDVRDQVEEEIENEDFKPVFRAADPEQGEKRDFVDVPKSFIELLYDSILDTGLSLRSRTLRRFESFLGLEQGALKLAALKAAAKKKKKKKRRADVEIDLRIERQVSSGESGEASFKRVKRGAKRTKNLNSFKLSKLKSGTYRARYRVRVKRSGKKRGSTTSFSEPSESFEIIR